MQRLRHLTGFQTFTVIWSGQLVSMLGTAMTRFALIIWAYQQTGAATTLALLGFFAWLPYVLVSPFAGVLIDRLNRTSENLELLTSELRQQPSRLLFSNPPPPRRVGDD